MSDVIALTGVTGFVGQRVLRRLSGSGKRLRVLVRNKARLSAPHTDCEIVEGDLTNPAALRQLVKDADCVIHIAGAIAAPSAAAFHTAG